MESIIAKAQKCMGTSEKKREVQTYTDNAIMRGKVFSLKSIGGSGVHTPEEAATMFINVLRSEIASHAGSDASSGQLGGSAISALSGLSFSSPQNIAPGVFTIEVNFDDDLYRQSMSSQSDDVQNIAALLNSGYNASKQVFGMWHGHKQASLKTRAGAHFIDNAIKTFMSTYATEYGVIDIEVNEAYK